MPDRPLPELPGLELEAELGDGYSGLVYRARQVDLDRPVAVKMLRPVGGGGREELARFRQEIELLCQVSHPSLVPLYQVDLEHQPPYYTMELMSGGDLADRIKVGPLRGEAFMDLVQRLAEGLAYLHGRGMVHRDIKPENVFFDRSGRAYLGDLGLGTWDDRERLTATGVVLGTPNYLAPEFLEGEKASEASDLYALGLVLAEAATGQRVGTETIARGLPQTLVEAIEARELRELVVSWTGREPSGRRPRAVELASRWQRLREGERLSLVPGRSPGSAGARGAVAREPGKPRPRWLLPGFWVAGLLFLGGLLGGGIWWGRGTSRPGSPPGRSSGPVTWEGDLLSGPVEFLPSRRLRVPLVRAVTASWAGESGRYPLAPGEETSLPGPALAFPLQESPVLEWSSRSSGGEIPLSFTEIGDALREEVLAAQDAIDIEDLLRRDIPPSPREEEVWQRSSGWLPELMTFGTRAPRRRLRQAWERWALGRALRGEENRAEEAVLAPEGFPEGDFDEERVVPFRGRPGSLDGHLVESGLERLKAARWSSASSRIAFDWPGDAPTGATERVRLELEVRLHDYYLFRLESEGEAWYAWAEKPQRRPTDPWETTLSLVLPADLWPRPGAEVGVELRALGPSTGFLAKLRKVTLRW